MAKQRTIEGLTIEYNGETIDNISNVYIDAYDNGNISFSYEPKASTSVNVKCKLSEVKINYTVSTRD